MYAVTMIKNGEVVSDGHKNRAEAKKHRDTLNEKKVVACVSRGANHPRGLSKPEHHKHTPKKKKRKD